MSDSVYEELQQAGFENLRRIPFDIAYFESFPYNIEVGFSVRTNMEHADTFIISATQEDFARHKDFFIELLNFSKNTKFKFDLMFIFTAGDERKLSGNERTRGTEFYCRSIEGAQNIRALVLDMSATKKTYITAGGKKEVSPLYLTRNLSKSLEENSIEHSISGGMFISLYNVGVIESPSRLSSFLAQSIPSIMLSMLAGKENYNDEIKSIESFLNKFELEENNNWSRHYIPIKLGSTRLWFTEQYIILFVGIFTAICLLILSDFAFLFRKRSRRLVEIKMRALKSTYLIFFTAAILTAALFVGQAIVGILAKAGARNLMVLFILKVSIPFFIVSILYPIELKLHKNLPPYIYEYILTISALLNIFIFSIFDISLFFLFAIEYIILALSRTVKRTVSLYAFMTFFLLPFVPLVYSILIYSDASNIVSLIFCGTLGNILLAFSIVPLSLLWLRVLLLIDTRASSTKRWAALYIMFSAISIAGIAIIATSSILIINMFFFKNVEPRKSFAQIENSRMHTFSNVRVYDSEYYSGKTRQIEISSIKEAERYEISIEDESANPVYFSIFETNYENGRTEFLLPENPPKKLNVFYTPNASEKSLITVRAFFQKENSQSETRPVFRRETFVFEVSEDGITELRQ